MIDIKKTGNATTIQANVTEFTEVIGYCEHLLPLIIKGVSVPTPKAMIRGHYAHKLEEVEEARRAELVPVTEEVLADTTAEIEFAREDVYTALDATINTAQGITIVRLLGRIDKIARAGGSLLVSDDKFVKKPELYQSRSKPYDNQMLQVLVYLNSKFYGTSARNDAIDIPHETKEWAIHIRDSATRDVVKTFQEKQDEGMLNYLFENIEHFALIALGEIERVHHNNPRKCAPCKYSSVCKYFIDAA